MLLLRCFVGTSMANPINSCQKVYVGKEENCPSYCMSLSALPTQNLFDPWAGLQNGLLVEAQKKRVGHFWTQPLV